jgi:hypothetical protein
MEAMISPHERALRDIDEVFGDRLKRGRSPRPPGAPDTGEALASVSPMSAEEVEILVKAAGRYSVPLVALGAGAASTPQGGSILVRLPNSSRYLFNVCKKEGTFIGHPRTMSSTCITSLSFLTSLP